MYVTQGKSQILSLSLAQKGLALSINPSSLIPPNADWVQQCLTWWLQPIFPAPILLGNSVCSPTPSSSATLPRLLQTPLPQKLLQSLFLPALSLASCKATASDCSGFNRTEVLSVLTQGSGNLSLPVLPVRISLHDRQTLMVQLMSVEHTIYLPEDTVYFSGVPST